MVYSRKICAQADRFRKTPPIENHNDVIRLFNLVFYGYHGVEGFEKAKGQRFEIDVELFLDLSRPCRSDQVKDTVDYSSVYQLVEEVVVEKEFNLLEALAENIANAILERFPVDEITVRVRKPNAPIRGLSDGVEIEITRT